MRGGGVIYNLGRTIVYTYAWNLSITSNNVVGDYVLLQGLNLTKTFNSLNIIVVGDSKLMVKYLIFDLSP